MSFWFFIAAVVVILVIVLAVRSSATSVTDAPATPEREPSAPRDPPAAAQKSESVLRPGERVETLAVDVLLERIRALPDLRFATPGTGAVAAARVAGTAPSGEKVKGLDDVQQAFESVRKTVQHPMRHDAWVDQWGNGLHLELERTVTTGEEQWVILVELLIDPSGQVAIDKVKAETREPEEVAATDLLPCPCCRHATLSERGQYQICPVCFWEDDGRDDDQQDEGDGPNRVTLRQARANYLAFGANCEEDRAHVRPPNEEERRES